MTIQAATPYLVLGGQAEQAIEFYKGALRAKVEATTRFGDMDKSCPEALRNRIMHAVLRVGSALIFLSDGSPEDKAPEAGGGVSIALDISDVDELRRVFDALSAGGQVVAPVMDAPWGAWFAALNDKFKINWMLNCTKK